MLEIVKSFWTSPGADESTAPENRIIHAKTVRFRGIGRNVKIGFCVGDGYFKCGSDKSADCVASADIYIERDGEYILYKKVRDIDVTGKECVWYQVKAETRAVCVIVRKSRIDVWWPCYNIARSGIKIEADEDYYTQGERRILKPVRVENQTLPEGVSRDESSVAVVWSTPRYKLGVRKKSAGLYCFSVDGEAKGDTRDNLLKRASLMDPIGNTDYTLQGPVVYPLCEGDCCNTFNLSLSGESEVGQNTVRYSLRHEATGLGWSVTFTALADRIKIALELEADKDCRFALLSLFRMSFNSEMTPLTLLAEPEKTGETGLVTFKDGKKAILHFPRYGSALCSGEGLSFRMQSVRDEKVNVIDLTLPGLDCKDGSVLIRKGSYKGEAELCFKMDIPRNVRPDTPEIIKRTVEKFEFSALPFRMDTAVFSNNGNSMSAPICLDLWAEICMAIGDGGFPKVSPMLENTLEHWMAGCPQYATGWAGDHSHLFEDEYIMTGTASLSGLGAWLCKFADKEWFDRFGDTVRQKLIEAKARVKDDDGIPVSEYRRGVSGEGQWSTCWYDVISYGHKDALATAILYRALGMLKQGFGKFGDKAFSDMCGEWADTIKQNYRDTFMTENGWLAGWKCAEGVLHDYAFLAVNGLAVSSGLLSKEEGSSVIHKLWQALLDSGFDNFDIGLPGNIYTIPQKDLAWPQIILPFGGYENAGVTLSQSCHFLRGMLSVGMEKEARFVLEKMADGMCKGLSIGGVASGIDWQTWDGVASGYEGFLCDQMGVIAVMLEIWGE